MNFPRFWSVLLCALFLLAACGNPEEVAEETPAPAATPTVAPAVTLTPTPRPTATTLPTVTPTHTATPEPEMLLLPGWALFGNDHFGLLTGAPQSWVDWSWALRDAGIMEQFGPLLLMVADSQETAERIMSGTGLGGGAYTFGFLNPTGGVVLTAEQALKQLLVDLDPAELLGEPVEFTVNDLEGIYIDVGQDPLNLFPALTEPQITRLLILKDSETDALATFVMSASTDGWITHLPTFEAMVETITFVPLKGTIAGHIDSGTLVNGSLENSRKDVWSFNGNSGRYVTIALTPEEDNIDLTLTLIDPTGNVLVSIDNGFASDSESLTDFLLPEDGTYIIEVGEFFSEAGRYTISLLLLDELQFGGGGRIEFGQEVSSELADNASHSWFFSGTAGQLVTILLTPLDNQLDAIMELESPDEELLFALDEGFAGDAEVVTGFELEVTGDYIITVYGFAGNSGSYTLSLDLGDESTANFYDAGDLVYGETADEFLQADEAHAWFLDGRLGDGITIVVTPLDSNLDLDVWLLDPEAQPLINVDDFLSGQPETIDYVLITNGQYIILVRDFFGEPGDYEISVQLNDESETEVGGEITYGQTVSGTVHSGKRVEWTFAGQIGDVLDITLRPTSQSRDLILTLVDPDGNIVLNVDSALSGLPERLSAFTITAEGQWKILIQEFFNEDSGYELTLLKQET